MRVEIGALCTPSARFEEVAVKGFSRIGHRDIADAVDTLFTIGISESEAPVSRNSIGGGMHRQPLSRIFIQDCLEERPSDSLTVEPLRHKEKGDVPVWGHGEHSGQSAPQKGAKHL